MSDEKEVRKKSARKLWNLRTKLKKAKLELARSRSDKKKKAKAEKRIRRLQEQTRDEYERFRDGY
jgi:hypothetical protein